MVATVRCLPSATLVLLLLSPTAHASGSHPPGLRPRAAPLPPRLAALYRCIANKKLVLGRGTLHAAIGAVTNPKSLAWSRRVIRGLQFIDSICKGVRTPLCRRLNRYRVTDPLYRTLVTCNLLARRLPAPNPHAPPPPLPAGLRSKKPPPIVILHDIPAHAGAPRPTTPRAVSQYALVWGISAMRRGKLHEALSLLRVAIRHMRGWSVNRYLATVLHRLGYTREALAVVMRFRRTADKIDRADVDKLLGQWRADLAKRKRAPRHRGWRARHSR